GRFSNQRHGPSRRYSCFTRRSDGNRIFPNWPTIKTNRITHGLYVYRVRYCSLVLLVYNLILQNQFLGYSPTIWLWFFALAVIPTFLGHTLFNWALKCVSTSTISIAIVFEPIGASILAYFILGEVVTASQWLGGTVVIFGLFLFTMSTTKKKKVTLSYKKDNDG